MRKSRTTDLGTGLFVLLGFAAFFFLTTQTTSKGLSFTSKPHYDVIAKFDGKPVADFEGLIDLIAEKNPGDVIKLEILRGDDDDMRVYERLRAIKEPNPAKELLEELRKRLTIEVEVTLGEWK